MVADQFKWSPVRATTGIDLFDKEISINVGATFDMYALERAKPKDQ